MMELEPTLEHLDLSQIRAPPSTPALERLRRNAERARSAQALRRRRQLEEEIASEIEEAGVSTPRVNIRNDVNKIARRLTSSRKQRMGGGGDGGGGGGGFQHQNEESDTKRDLQDDEENDIHHRIPRPRSSSTPSPSFFPDKKTSGYSTPVKDFRHYPIVSSASRLHQISTTPSSVRRRRTKEQKRREDSEVRMNELRRNICREANVNEKQASSSSSTSPSLIVSAIEQSLHSMSGRLDRGRRKSVVMKGAREDDLENDGDAKEKEDGEEEGENGEKKEGNHHRETSNDPRCSAFTVTRQHVDGSLARRRREYATTSPPSSQQPTTTTTFEKKTAGVENAASSSWSNSSLRIYGVVVAVVLAAGGVVALLSRRSLQSGVEESSSASSGGRSDTQVEKITSSSSMSPSVLIIMMFATLTWLYAAWRVLKQRGGE